MAAVRSVAALTILGVAGYVVFGGRGPKKPYQVEER
jgi:hypothetical protein